MKHARLLLLIAIAFIYSFSFPEPDHKGSSRNKNQDTLVLALPIQPSFTNKYARLKEEQYDAFIEEWKDWSNQLRAFSTDSLVNQAVRRVFADYTGKRRVKYAVYSLPGCIEVRKYTCTYSSLPYVERWNDDYDEYKNKASERFSYVPSFDADREIVYLAPEIETCLSNYIGGVSKSKKKKYTFPKKLTKVNEDRLAILCSLIEVNPGHWGGYWHLCSMPIINRIFLYDDGFVADLRTTWCTGETVFIPYDTTKEKKSLSSWIE